MRKHVKRIAKKYIPNILKPCLYQCYSYVNILLNNLISYSKRREAYIEFKNSVPIQELLTSQTIQILQPTFYDVEGEIYLSGGAERYLCDLSEIIINLGYKPYIVQHGNKFWHKKHNNLIDVFGVPSVDRFGIPLNGFALLNILAHESIFGKPKLRIYSNFVVAYPKVDYNSIGIAHGMFWSSHPNLYTTLPINKAFSALSTFVSVDKATISWFRGMMPKEMLEGKKHIRYIPNYVDLEKFYPIERLEDNKIRIIYPRRLYHICGYFLMDEIVSNILTKYPHVEFHFVGQADEQANKAIKKLVKKFTGRVLWYFQAAENMNEIYRKSDITVIPTIINEGTSLSCIEAMATGNAIIASNVGGLSDLIIDNYNGLLINPPNSQELQQKIEELISNPNLRKRLGDNALAVAQCFDQKIWQAKWLEILNRSLNNRK